MTITLTREEAQQVLDALDVATTHFAKDRQEILAAIETLRARLSAPEPEPWQVIPDSVGTKQLTEMKAKSIIERDGRVVTGYVLDTNDSVCIVYHSAVRWFSNEDMFRVMHSDAAPQQPEPPCKTGSQCIGGKCRQCVVSEPVAWMNEGDIGKTDWKVWAHGKPTATIPLYTAPPQREEGCAECSKKSSDGWALYCVKCSEREWQGLTDEDKAELDEQYGDDVLAHLDAIEVKLKEKNT